MSRTTSDGRTAATIRDRALAYVADAVAVLGSFWILAGRRWRSVPRRVAAAILGAGIVAFPYHVLLEGAFGRTPGKALVGIAVVGEDGSPCTLLRATVRTALRFVDWLPAGYVAGLLSIAFTERRQRVGDLLAGTVVVRTRGRGGGRDRDDARS